MWLRKIKRNKKQYLGVALILIFATSILVGCAAFVAAAKSNTTAYYDKCVDYVTYVTKGKSSSEFENAIKKENKINIEDQEDMYALNDVMKINGESVKPFYLFLSTLKDYHKCKFPINIYKGETCDKPSAGTIWISKVYADNKHLKLGDTIEISNKKFEISAIIRSALEPNSLDVSSVLYCNQTDFASIKDKVTPLNCYMLSIGDYDEETMTKFLSNSISDYSANVLVARTTMSIKMNVDMLVTVVGGIGVLAAFMIFVAAVAIIQFIVKSNITEEYRTIGIHKALGDTSKMIQGFYIKSYVFVGLIAITTGAIIGIPISKYLSDIITKNIADFPITSLAIWTSFACIIVLLLVLYLCLKKTLHRINKITPVEAIRMGMTSSKRKLKKSLIKNANSSFVVAINDIFRKKGNSFMMFALLTLSIYLSLFFVNMNYSAQSMKYYPNLWFGMPKSSVTLSGNVSKELKEYVQNKKEVKNVYAGNILSRLDIKSADKNDKIDYSLLSEIVSEDWDESKTGVKLVEGREPKNENEIVLGTLVLQKSKCKIGDYINVKLCGKDHTFLITGSISSMMNGSYIALLHGNINNLIAQDQYPFEEIFVNLKNEDDFKTFKKDITSKFQDVAVEKQMEVISMSSKGITSIIEPVTAVLVVVFVLFSMMTIVNLLEMENLKNKRQYGILKALGRSNGYLCRKLIWKIAILSVLATIVAVTINMQVSPGAFASFVGANGYVISMKYSAGVLAIILGTIFVATIGFCVPLRKISPKQLMDE